MNRRMTLVLLTAATTAGGACGGGGGAADGGTGGAGSGDAGCTSLGQSSDASATPTMVSGSPFDGGAFTSCENSAGIGPVPGPYAILETRGTLASDATGTVIAMFVDPVRTTSVNSMSDKLMNVSPAGELTTIHDLSASPKQSLHQALVDGDTIFFGWGGAGVTELDSIPRAGGTPVTLYQGNPGSIVSDSTNLFFVDGDRVVRMPKTGGTPTVLATRPGQAIFQLFLDGATLYWAEYPSCRGLSLTVTFWTVPAGGGTPSAFAPTLAPQLTVSQFVVAGGTLVFVIGSANSFTFVSEISSGLYQLARGGRPTVLVATAVSPIALDGDTVFYANIGGSSRIGRIPVAGGTPILLPMPTGHAPTALAVAPSSLRYLGPDTCLYQIPKVP